MKFNHRWENCTDAQFNYLVNLAVSLIDLHLQPPFYRVDHTPFSPFSYMPHHNEQYLCQMAMRGRWILHFLSDAGFANCSFFHFFEDFESAADFIELVTK